MAWVRVAWVSGARFLTAINTKSKQLKNVYRWMMAIYYARHEIKYAKVTGK